MSKKAVIFDYNRTVFNPDTGALMPDAHEVLVLLQEKEIPMFLVAKGDDDRKKQIESLGLPPFFQKIIVNQNKSSDDFQLCIDSCEAGTLFFAVGDRVKEEIRHANACGATTIWFRNGKFATEEPGDSSETPNFTVENLKQAIEIVLKS